MMSFYDNKDQKPSDFTAGQYVKYWTQHRRDTDENYYRWGVVSPRKTEWNGYVSCFFANSLEQAIKHYFSRDYSLTSVMRASRLEKVGIDKVYQTVLWE